MVADLGVRPAVGREAAAAEIMVAAVGLAALGAVRAAEAAAVAAAHSHPMWKSWSDAVSKGSKASCPVVWDRSALPRLAWSSSQAGL